MRKTVEPRAIGDALGLMHLEAYIYGGFGWERSFLET
jgi:hypothetical protein